LSRKFEDLQERGVKVGEYSVLSTAALVASKNQSIGDDTSCGLDEEGQSPRDGNDPTSTSTSTSTTVTAASMVKAESAAAVAAAEAIKVEQQKLDKNQV
jgi:hypothetical protein